MTKWRRSSISSSVAFDLRDQKLDMSRSSKTELVFLLSFVVKIVLRSACSSLACNAGLGRLLRVALAV